MTLDIKDDFTTKEGAQRLADFIRAFWERQGHNVPVFVVKTFTGHGERHDVRSDLIGGMP